MEIVKIEVFENSELKNSSEQYINADLISRIRLLDNCAMLFMDGNNTLYVDKADALELIGAYSGKVTSHTDKVECFSVSVVDDVDDFLKDEETEIIAELEAEQYTDEDLSLFDIEVNDKQKESNSSKSKKKGH